jgi:hypothetical protein
MQPQVHRSAFVGNLKVELSVATMKGNALFFKACIGQMTGKAFQRGATCPHAKVAKVGKLLL